MAERKLNVLVVDFSTGRSSALIEAYANHPEVGTVSVTSRNDIAQDHFGKDKVHVFPHIRPDSPVDIKKLVDSERAHLVDIAQDVSIRAGVADTLRQARVLTVGPDAQPGKLEWDKVHGRRFARTHNIPVPAFVVYGSALEAIALLGMLLPDKPTVIKASGLAEGKGVDVTDNIAQAKLAVQRIAHLPDGAGSQILIEQRVGGPNAREFSGYYMGSYMGSSQMGRQRFTPLGFARDYKRVFDGDKGPNTGGMGAVLFPGLINEHLQQRIYENIVRPTAEGLMREEHPYRGVLYIGGMYDPDQERLWLIEYNARWGDPEAEVVIPHLSATNDFLALSLLAANDFRLFQRSGMIIDHNNKAYISVAGCSKGYPEDYSTVKGRKIEGLDQIIRDGDVRVYGAGVVKEDGAYYANGGRIFHLVAEADTVDKARMKVFAAMEKIHIPGDKPSEDLLHYRREIGL